MSVRPASPSIVHVVEDDAALADALLFLLQSRGLEARHFASAEDLLAHVAESSDWPHGPACLLLDVRMKRMSGLELFERLAADGHTELVPIVFLTGHGDIGMAVDALKRGAYDFFEKPFNDNRLADRLIEALAESACRIDSARDAASVESCIASLSTREREVMDLVLAGKLNKVIAHELGISVRTVEVHRANIFAKMEVRSAVELARRLGPPGG